MKKLFTLITAAAMTLTALATDYTGTLTVTVNGESTPVENTTISVVNNGSDSYTLSINNFMLDGMLVGNIVLTTTGEALDDAVKLKVDDNITIADGDLEGVDFWLGSMLGEVPIHMVALFKEGAMFTNIDIYMAELEQTINVRFNADPVGYQIPNSDFENWPSNNNNEPYNWHGFKSAKGGFAGAAKGTLASSTDVRPGTSGSKSAVITSGSVFGIVNNGTITNGQLNAGSMSATNTANHSEMQKSNSNYYTHLVGRPDALKTWLKFTQKTANKSYPYATLSAIITDGSYYQDPEDKTYTNVTAKAQNKTIATCGWTELTVPFTGYTTVTPDAILVTVSTNATPGKGSSGDQVWVDDMELVYNGEITGIEIAGLNDFSFVQGTREYTVEQDIDLTVDDVTATKTGAYSYLVKNIYLDQDGNQVINVTALGNDLKVADAYVITVVKPEADPELYLAGSFNGWADGKQAMTYDAENGTFTITVDGIENGALFKFIDGEGTWYGGNTGGNEGNYGVHRDWCTDIELLAGDDGKYFEVKGSGNLTFTVTKADDKMTLTITGWDAPVVTYRIQGGVGENWENSFSIELTEQDGAFVATDQDIVALTEFKVVKNVDGTDTWYGAESNGKFLVNDDMLGNNITMLAGAGENLYFEKAGVFSFSFDAEKALLTVTGEFEVEGVTLEEALEGEEGDVTIVSDVVVVTAVNDYAIVSDGNGNWLKVTGLDLAKGQVVKNLEGVITLGTNPVMAATSSKDSEAQVTAAPTKVDIAKESDGSAASTLSALKANEVITVKGYYFAADSKIKAFAGGHGINIDVTTSHVSPLIDGKHYEVTGTVNFKEAEAGAPARIARAAADGSDITLDITENGLPTGVATIKAVDGKEIEGIYNLNGQKVNTLDGGVYIIRHTDGTATKVRF